MLKSSIIIFLYIFAVFANFYFDITFAIVLVKH